MESGIDEIFYYFFNLVQLVNLRLYILILYDLYSTLKSEMPLILSSKDNHKLITQELYRLGCKSEVRNYGSIMLFEDLVL